MKWLKPKQPQVLKESAKARAKAEKLLHKEKIDAGKIAEIVSELLVLSTRISQAIVRIQAEVDSVKSMVAEEQGILQEYDQAQGMDKLKKSRQLKRVQQRIEAVRKGIERLVEIHGSLHQLQREDREITALTDRFSRKMDGLISESEREMEEMRKAAELRMESLTRSWS